MKALHRSGSGSGMAQGCGRRPTMNAQHAPIAPPQKRSTGSPRQTRDNRRCALLAGTVARMRKPGRRRLLDANGERVAERRE